ncbi:helix-turn-helix domain-containing protein [Rhizobium ruizarguesonis]|uniref:helix-turn-helix domain-containing protein n=1 Tax=Rhizobium ruizarguesonis TaxID=2081791 RepID=UPI00102FE702|nr:helix-turn-helix transcriptional regulator [Rhizobium ruizarguesonis]TAT84830.1 XRE family transcriptional regulator [Rhizobium ruizarguesonis]
MLAAARFILGKTQAEVGHDSGLSTQTVFKAENGRAGLSSILKLLDHYAERGVEFMPPEGSSGWGLKVGSVTKSYQDEFKARPTEPAAESGDAQ